MSQAVYFLLLPNVLSLDVSGPAETLRLAGQFSLRYLSPVPQIVCSIGMTLSGLQPLPERLEDGAILVLPGVGDSQRYFAGEEAEQARRWLATLRPDLQQQRITLVCICSGALLAAQAGLLDGYQCTTHHDVIERIRRQVPAAQVKENRIFVEDRGVYTSAGITTGIDLALHLVHRHCGAGRARDVARDMVVYFRRAGDDPQLSPWLRYRNHLHPAVHRAQDVMAAEPEADWSVPQVAEKRTSAAATWRGCFAATSASACGNIMSSCGWRWRNSACSKDMGWRRPRWRPAFLPGDSCAAPSSASARRYDTSRRVSSRCRPTDSSRLSPSATPNTQKISSSGWPVKSRCRLRITLTIRA